MRRHHRKLREDADLDITAFMNLMIVLVPILLINMIFAHTSILELNFPNSSDSQEVVDEQLQLQVIIFDEEIVVSDSKGGVIKQIKNSDGYDFEMLEQTMKAIKSRMPDKRDVTVMAKADTSYQTLVTVMDTVRSYQTVVAGSVVHAELFPDISISDAPEGLKSSDNVAHMDGQNSLDKVES